jgi:MarR family transcriptional regulator, lower aerobic nicotinate degradation pathway regulator
MSGYDFSQQIGHMLRRAYQRHVAIFQQTVPESRLTAAQFVVLCAVHDRAGCDIADVVRATAIDEASVRGIVERLKWRELLTAEHEAGDTRHMRLTLTEAGRTLHGQTVPHAHEISEQTYGAMSAEQRATLVALLRKMSGIDAA